MDIEDDMRVAWANSLLNVSKGAGDQKKKASQKSEGEKKPRKWTFIVHRGWHAGPMSLQVPQRFKRGMRSKEKGKWPNIRSQKNPRKEILLYVEDDMRVPFCSSGPNVSNAAWDQKKKKVARN